MAIRGGDTSFLATIQSFYAAAVGGESWTSAMDRLLAEVNFDGVAIWSLDRRTGEPADALWHRLPEERETYLRDYLAICPRYRFILDNPGTRILYDHQHTPESAIDRSAFFAWFQRASQGLRYSLGGQAAPDSSLALVVACHRPRAPGHASEAEIERFASLFDHLEAALVAHHRLGLARATAARALELVQASGEGVVMLSRDGRVVFVNAAAERVLARADALKIDKGWLRAMRARDEQALQERLAAALSPVPASRLGPAGARSLMLDRATGGRPYLVDVTPSPSSGALFSALEPAALVRIHDPDAAFAGFNDVLRDLYGLTAAELAVCARLRAGDDVRAAAASLGVGEATLRWHLRNLFRKTRTARQADLVRLLLSLPRDLGA